VKLFIEIFTTTKCHEILHL